MNAILGISFRYLAWFSSGIFCLPFIRWTRRVWQRYWLIRCIFYRVFVTPLTAFLTISDHWEIRQNESSSVLQLTFLLNALWGIDDVTFDRFIRYSGTVIKEWKGVSKKIILAISVGNVRTAYLSFNYMP